MSQDERLEDAKAELRRAELLVLAEAAKAKWLVRKAWRIQQRADALRKSLAPQPS